MVEGSGANGEGLGLSLELVRKLRRRDRLEAMGEGSCVGSVSDEISVSYGLNSAMEEDIKALD